MTAADAPRRPPGTPAWLDAAREVAAGMPFRQRLVLRLVGLLVVFAPRVALRFVAGCVDEALARAALELAIVERPGTARPPTP